MHFGKTSGIQTELLQGTVNTFKTNLEDVWDSFQH